MLPPLLPPLPEPVNFPCVVRPLPELPDLQDEPLPPLLPELPALVECPECHGDGAGWGPELAIPPDTRFDMGDGMELHFPTGGTLRHAPGCTACNDTGKDPDGTACSYCEIVRLPTHVAQVFHFDPEQASAIRQDGFTAMEQAAQEFNRRWLEASQPTNVTPWFHPDDAPVRDGCYEVQIRFGEIVKLEWNCAKQLWYYPSAEMCCEHGSLHVVAFGWRGLTYEAYHNEQAKV